MLHNLQDPLLVHQGKAEGTRETIEARASITKSVGLVTGKHLSSCGNLTKEVSSAFRSSLGGIGGYTQVDIIGFCYTGGSLGLSLN